MIHDAAIRSRSFGAAAELYDRSRPSYPSALIDDLLALTPRHILDVGCGTGKVSELFVARGADVLALDPDARMAAVARRKDIRVEVSAFETWDPAGRVFDLVVAGQSWHWVSQPQGALQAHKVLQAGGHLAAFWNIGMHEQQSLDALDPVYVDVAPTIAETTTALRFSGHQVEQRHDDEVLAQAGFSPVEVRSYPWSAVYSAAQWLDYIGTHSDHLSLPEAQRKRLLRGVGDAIDSLGGSLTYHFTTVLVLATRL
ncbi:MAG: class I SAM-dependent methyltransferase [Candidatus Dormibacteraeota bacterium]|nr:class I SAM-dependent methyltransferase [Candidatus Dormibacteraeota bacterium]